MTTDDTDVLRLSAGDLVEAYTARRTSPVEVTRALLHAVHAAQESLNCFVEIDEPGALRTARLPSATVRRLRGCAKPARFSSARPLRRSSPTRW
jgi:Asp-tRNA(Asn)/Glu-tRNA(Gln) amidotransferase A subunit family amidase